MRLELITLFFMHKICDLCVTSISFAMKIGTKKTEPTYTFSVLKGRATRTGPNISSITTLLAVLTPDNVMKQ